ncbi:MAG TPA: hypothetical protein VJ453_11700 [Terriglobales bacterium]|jgi:hypothetical protein|nr:hypothetical protein [Terriglobales bacterium]
MLQILTELLNYARKLLPLMELYAARRAAAAPVRDHAVQDFQNHLAEVLRTNRADVIEIRSALESLHQRLKVVDDQSVSLQRDLARIAGQYRTIVIAVIIAAAASVGAFVTAIIAASRH